MEENWKKSESFTDIVLEYLKLHEPTKPETDTYDIILTSDEIVRDILKELLDNFDRCERLKDEYEYETVNHNQYPLFNLRESINDFFIDDSLYHDLTYRETLVVGYSDKIHLIEPSPCGGACLNIERARGKEPLTRITPDLFKKEIYDKLYNQMHMNYDREIKCVEEMQQYVNDLKENLEDDFTKFLIHYSCKFNVNGQEAGERITSWVDKNLHTIEESRTEFIHNNGKVNTKKLYVCLKEGKYFVKHYNSIDNYKEYKYYSLQKTKKYISEGANFVLMRFLAKTRFLGQLKMSAAYINGDMCLNVYDCKGPASGVFNGKKLDICQIYRTIIEECGLTHQAMSVLTLDGQILKQEWKNVYYMLYINPKADLKNAKPRRNTKILLEQDWQNDLQLYSAYLDAKIENKMHVTSYLSDHPEIHNLIADYVQQILQIKPINVIDFTVNYFSTYAPKYFEKFWTY